MSDQPSSFTGRRRNRKTHWSVKAKDRLAHVLIMSGGIGTIVAVSTVCIFLIVVVIPLFLAPQTDQASQVVLARVGEFDVPEAAKAHLDHLQPDEPIHVVVDDYNLLAWAVFPDGSIRLFRLDNGEVLDEVNLAPDAPMTAWSFPQRGDLAVLGYADGSVRMVNIDFSLRFFEADPDEDTPPQMHAPEHLRRLDVLAIENHEKGLVQMTRERQLRYLTLSVELQDAIATGSDQPVLAIDHTGTRREINYIAMTADGRAFLQRARGTTNMLTGQATYRTTTSEIEYEPRHELPSHVKLSGLGDNAYMIWQDGILYRFDTRDFNNIFLTQVVDLSPRPGVDVTSIGFMIGKTTLVVGDSEGTVTGWFRVTPDNVERQPNLTVRMREVDLDADGRNRGDARDVRVAAIETGDPLALVPVWQLSGDGAGKVTSVSPSQRKRVLVVGHADGRVRAHNVTNERFLLEVMLGDGIYVNRVVLNPRDNGLVAMGERYVALWHLDMPHPEVSLRALFQPIWYEGRPEPLHVWQSTGGTDDFESKFGLMPLIFGTIKATFYSMMFAVPLALLAAIFTSEFLHPKIKSKVKPTIEMMASLPSVVLGFLAGLVVAQFVEDKVPALLMAFITIPVTWLFASYVWQMLPRVARLRIEHLRFAFMLLAIPVGIWLAALTGPVVERALFSVEILDRDIAAAVAIDQADADAMVADEKIIVHDIVTWLSAHRQDPQNPQFASSPIGGWMILFTPLSILFTAVMMTQWINPWLVGRAANWSANRLPIMDMAKFLVGGVFAIGLALMLSTLVGVVFGFDARGSYIDQYAQRNALVVGFIMGFAVIPIIYTIADDAMSAVPEHLRTASLGAGATRWQTAVRVIVPTAMSGLFSACMIGFGRAVGETMIVLMAAGNTPIMEWNIFNGFRTLSANIAVEMMEAVEDSTNYRILFLAAVVLFSMTFVVNTIAEVIRLRYRKRAYQL